MAALPFCVVGRIVDIKGEARVLMNGHHEAGRRRTFTMLNEAFRTEMERETTKGARPNEQSVRSGTPPVRRYHNVRLAAYQSGERSVIGERQINWQDEHRKTFCRVMANPISGGAERDVQS